MNRRIWIYILLLALLVPTTAEAQRWKLRRYEGIIGVGASHPFMDIAKTTDALRAYQLAATRPNVTFGARFKVLEYISAGVDLSYVMFGGYDVDEALTVNSFMTHGFEHVATVQYNIISEGRAFGSSTAVFNRRGMINNYNTADFYIFAGFGGILTKGIPRDELGEKIQNDRYYNNNTNYGIVFPMGLGLRISMNAYWSLGLEVGGRLSTSDLLDGYATPFSEYNDRYILTTFKAVYKIRNDRRGRPIFSKYGR